MHWQEARAEIAPWEAKMAEEQGRRGVAASERDLLVQKQEAVKRRRQVNIGWRFVLAQLLCPL